jgi:hypothetical protein
MADEDAAEFDVFCPGILDVLSIGRGDLRLMVGTSDEDREKAKALIEEMLRAGYAIFVETDKGLVKVKRFNPKRMTYVIMDAPETPTPIAGPTPVAPPKAVERDVPVAGSRATAVGRTAGG